MFKTTTLLIGASFGLATAACAQDTTYGTDADVLEPAADHFAASDMNADGALDRTEFEAFIRAKADAGEADYVALAETGELDVEFMMLDANADGSLDATEVDRVEEVEVDVDVETDIDPMMEPEG